MTVTIKGNSRDTVSFESHWGTPNFEDVLVTGESAIGTYTPVATPTAEPTPESGLASEETQEVLE